MTAFRRAAPPLAALLVFAVLAAAALAAPGPKLTADRAGQRSERFAAGTCERDPHCVRHGVVGCTRERHRVMICRIFDDRETGAQGRYRCERRIRVALDPRTRLVPVTGLGRWRC